MKMERMILIAAMVVVTFIPRAIPAALIERMRFPKKVEKFLNLIPYTAMASLIFPGILTVDGSNVLIGLFGGAAAAVLAYLRAPLIVCVVSAILVDMALYLI